MPVTSASSASSQSSLNEERALTNTHAHNATFRSSQARIESNLLAQAPIQIVSQETINKKTGDTITTYLVSAYDMEMGAQLKTNSANEPIELNVISCGGPC